MNQEALKRFVILFEDFHRVVCALGNEFPQGWTDGFLTVIAHGKTSDADDNIYLPNEEPGYTNYKTGARAAEELMRCRVR